MNITNIDIADMLAACGAPTSIQSLALQAMSWGASDDDVLDYIVIEQPKALPLVRTVRQLLAV